MQSLQTSVSANIKLFLRVSNTDLLETKECISFDLNISRTADSIEATATTSANWAQCWRRGIEPIRRIALQSIHDTVRGVDETLPENDPRFMAAMVLIASEMVGPYVDRLVSFLEYQHSFVAAIAARLVESRVWDGDEVRCEKWFDPEIGGTAILLDILVATGELMRTWSEEKSDYIYAAPEIRTHSHRVC